MLSAVYAVVVCLCVCVSVILRYCIKTAKRSITQMMPHDRPELQFYDTKVHGEIQTGSPGATNAGWMGYNWPLLTKNAL